jgi:hypothetical protein
MDVILDPGATVARHTHPGIESSYMMEGELELPIQGQPTRSSRRAKGFRFRRTRRTPAARRATPGRAL